jgi:acyl-coenzyme A thioesterase PaaI-like protein
MKLSFYNRNALGTHFGGSLYAMCDPFFALILIDQLGPEYAVWDKSSTIEFRRPGRGTVSASFEIPPEQVAEIQAAADAGEVVEPVFEVDLTDESGAVVARVTKTIHVSHKTRRAT